jgi:hypothetical protein
MLVAAAQKKKKCNASIWHTTKLEQSISLDIYGQNNFDLCWHQILE